MRHKEIEPQSSRKVELTFHSHSNPSKGKKWVYFKMKKDRFSDLGGDVIIQPGLYPRNCNVISVTATNLVTETNHIPVRMKIGIVQEADGLEDTDLAVNALLHKPVGELSPEELQERKDFIRESLNLGDNVSSADRERFEAIFLENFDALSLNEYDFGKTDLLKFHIQVPKDMTPVRAKC